MGGQPMCRHDRSGLTPPHPLMKDIAMLTTSLPRALVFMTGRNCEMYVRAALDSLARQTHDAVHVLFIDDASTDETPQLARRLLADLFPGRHGFIGNPEPWGKARNAHVHLRAALDKGDFVAVLDADDQLIVPGALALMADAYASGYDVVWTDYVMDDGRVGGNGPLDPFRSPRGQGWKTSHFFSFRSELFEGVPEDRFQDAGGRWLTAACDFAIAYPILDQTRRYRHLPVRAYRYTATNPQSHHNRDPQSRGLNSRAQQSSAATVLAKPPLPCHRWVMGELACADQAFGALRDSLSSGGRPAEAPRARVESPQSALAPARPAQAPATQPLTAGPVGQDAWLSAAAAELAARCPAWLDLALDGQSPPLPVALAWQWWRWLQRAKRPPRVLEVGADPMSAYLHAAVRAMGGRMVTVSGERARAEALYVRLKSAGIESEVLHSPLVNASFASVSGRFPDLGLLPDDVADIDVVVVSAAHSGAAPLDCSLALPMTASRLCAEGFRFCVWAPGDPGLRQTVADRWAAFVPELSFADGAFGGQALCVHSPEPLGDADEHGT